MLISIHDEYIAVGRLYLKRNLIAIISLSSNSGRFFLSNERTVVNAPFYSTYTKSRDVLNMNINEVLDRNFSLLIGSDDRCVP